MPQKKITLRTPPFMKPYFLSPWKILTILFTSFLFCNPLQAQEVRTVTDSLGRQLSIPSSVDEVICSGPGCLRLLTYLQAQDMVVAVADIEGRRSQFDARPYALANPDYKKLPIFGEFRGKDDPERILSLEKQPQVIFKTYARAMGYDPDELQQKINIPVIAVNYGDLSTLRPDLNESLRLMGKVIGREKRAEEVISFFEKSINDLANRTKDVAAVQQPLMAHDA